MKIFKTTILVSAMLTAQAQATPYFGGGVNYSKINYQDSVNVDIGGNAHQVNKGDYNADNVFGFNLLVGYDFKPIALELNYTRSLEYQQSNTDVGLVWTDSGNPVDVTTTIQTSMIDLNGLYNHDYKKVTFTVGGGLSYLMYDEEASFEDAGSERLAIEENEKGFGANIMTGVSYNYTDDVSVRFGVKYLKMNMDNVDSVVNYSLSSIIKL